MRSFPRSVMAFLAFLSLLATFVPSLAWACPVTGRIGTPREVCVATAQSRRSATTPMPCCRKQTGRVACVAMTATANQPCAETGHCCHVLLAPGKAPLAATRTSTSQVRAASWDLPQEACETRSTPAVGSRPVFVPTGPLPATDDVSPLHSQDAFSLHSGRAPPVLSRLIS